MITSNTIYLQHISKLTWKIILADSLKVLSTGESTGTVAVNCSSNCDVSSALFCKHLNTHLLAFIIATRFISIKDTH